jgi:histidinol phosphatase-like enzyme
MILEAVNNLNLRISDSIMIGDSETDMLAAKSAGIEHRILICSAVSSTVASEVVNNHDECLTALKEIIIRIQE